MKPVNIAEVKEVIARSKTLKETLAGLREFGFDGTHDDEKLYNLVSTLENRRHNVQVAAERIERTARTVIERVTLNSNLEYCGLNSSGELQGSGPAFDVEVALYVEAFRALIAELAGRANRENQARYDAAVAELTGVQQAVIHQLRLGSLTLPQLAAKTGWNRTLVEAAVKVLIDRFFVQQFKNHYTVEGLDRWTDNVNKFADTDPEEGGSLSPAGYVS
jgi:hypothetical protein